MIGFLKEEKVNDDLIRGVVGFRASHPVKEEERGRIPVPRYLYYGREVWEQTIAALLCGQNPLLAGLKVTGKNTLARNLATAFEGPAQDISLHVNMDAPGLVGTDTFQNRAVIFRPGSMYRCGISGGFEALDEINMARSEVLVVLRGVLGFRRTINVSGYDVMHMNGGARLIAIMSYGYASTRELNEILTSRFACLQMPAIPGENLEKLMSREYPGLKRTYARQFVRLFLDIDKKCQGVQPSTRPLDLRGLLDAARLMKKGLDVGAALGIGPTNKSFDPYEQNLVRDLIRARTPKKLEREKLPAD